MQIHPGPAMPDGLYQVGATSFTRPIPSSPVIGTSRLCPCTRDRKGERTCEHAMDEFPDLEPTLVMDEVRFVAFYPTDVERHRHDGFKSWQLWGRHKVRKGMRWFIRPVSESMQGYEGMMGNRFPEKWYIRPVKRIMSLYGARIQIPVYENAPLLRPPESIDSGRWPLVVLSHGLSGNATTYSTLAMHLASQGRVVLAIEHRDGSGAATFPELPSGKTRTVRYISPGEVIWPDGATCPRANDWTNGGYNSEVALRFRNDQLKFRQREIYEAVHAMRLMLTGQREKSALEVRSGPRMEWESWIGAVDADMLDLVGHSFGGATLFYLLSHGRPPMLTDPTQSYPPLRVRQTLALDPWMEALASPGPKPVPEDGGKDNAHQLLVLNSEAFTFFDSHFSALKDVVSAFAPSRIMTIIGAQHMSFSDIPAILPRAVLDADERQVLNIVCLIAQAFLQREIDLGVSREVLHVAGVTIRPMETKWEGSGKGKTKRLRGEDGHVVLH